MCVTVDVSNLGVCTHSIREHYSTRLIVTSNLDSVLDYIEYRPIGLFTFFLSICARFFLCDAVFLERQLFFNL